MSNWPNRRLNASIGLVNRVIHVPYANENTENNAWFVLGLGQPGRLLFQINPPYQLRNAAHGRNQSPFIFALVLAAITCVQ